MKEQGTTKGGSGWRKVDIGNGHLIDEKTVDPRIMAQMPKTARLFTEIGPIELLVEDVKRFLGIRS